MDKIEQERWNRMVLNHWWLRGHHIIVRSLIKKYLSNQRIIKGANCLDIGCSGGYGLDFLKEFGRPYGFDISFEGLSFYKQRDYVMAKADATRIPFKDKTFDVILLLEVAEHVEDDRLLFREIHRITKDSANIFVMVPVYNILWGSHDVKYLHKRRYSKRGFISLIESSDMTIKSMTFMHPHLFIPLLLLRLFDRMMSKQKMGARDDFISLGKVLDSLLFYTVMLENMLIQKVSFPFGICLFAVVQKKGT